MTSTTPSAKEARAAIVATGVAQNDIKQIVSISPITGGGFLVKYIIHRKPGIKQLTM